MMTPSQQVLRDAAVNEARQRIMSSGRLTDQQKTCWMERSKTVEYQVLASATLKGSYDPNTDTVTLYSPENKTSQRRASIVIHEVGHACGMGETEAEILEALTGNSGVTFPTACEVHDDIRYRKPNAHGVYDGVFFRYRPSAQGGLDVWNQETNQYFHIPILCIC